MKVIEQIRGKQISWQEAKRCIENENREGGRVVFTNGCFDIMHPGHVEYLAKASELGGRLLIGLNTDSSIERIKGTNRPINNQQFRMLMLASLSFIDGVIFFDEETPKELIEYIQPDILVKGSDYSPESIVGYDTVKAKGGRVETIDFVPGFSTTAIIDKIKNS